MASGGRRPYDLAPMSFAQRLRTPVSAWLATWSPILPILVAEFIIWIGFGSLLPIMPLYFRDHGVDFATLGIVVAAWPAARLIGEPIFGWVADRTRRVPLMVTGAALAGVFEFLPLVFVGAAPFILLRGLAGLLDRDVRPGRPGHGHRPDAARAPGRGVRPLLGGPDGRAAVRAGDRRPRARRSSAGWRSCSCSARSARSRPRSSSGSRCARRPARASSRPTTSYDLTEFPARPAARRLRRSAR